MNRRPIVAGQFYPADTAALGKMIAQYMSRVEEKEKDPTMAAMLPHAGYVFSGQVAGMTVASANLMPRMILLGPNHTGMGASMAVWPGGSWEIPGASVPVDEELARELLENVPGFSPDTSAHVQEHSLEVLLPFLKAAQPDLRIVPVAVSSNNADNLIAAGQALAQVIQNHPEPISIVVSSDMSHYVPHNAAKERDSLAVDKILDLDPRGLYTTVRQKGITMCGVLPMTLALTACTNLGAENARLVAYATSGDTSGDYSSVVGYAGIIIS